MSRRRPSGRSQRPRSLLKLALPNSVMKARVLALGADVEVDAAEMLKEYTASAEAARLAKANEKVALESGLGFRILRLF